MERTRYLIIGGGVAGTVAAEEIRKRDPQGRIVLVSAEDHPLYSRVLLPNYVKGKIPRQKVFLRSWEQYAQKGIDVLRGKKVLALDPELHHVTLDDQTAWTYEKLLIATGGDAVLPDGFATPDAHILPFRTIDDADRIREQIAATAEGSRAAIVGSGFIALEFAPFFRDAGFETHLYMRAPRYFSKRLDEGSSKLIESALSEKDVAVHRGTAITSCITDADGVTLTHAEDEEHFSVVGVGLGLSGVPSFAHDAGLETEEGIITNAFLETNLPDVWAAGDCAEFEDVTIGRRHTLGNWANADAQGRCVGANMAGAGEAPTRLQYQNVSQYSTRIFDTVIGMIGDVSGTNVETIVRAAPEAKMRAQLFLKDGRLVGATLINGVTERNAIMLLIKNKTDLSAVRDALLDPGIPLARHAA